MPRWKAPDLPDGPLRELNRALHALHGRAGWPSSRDLQKAVGGHDVVSYTTIHQALTKPLLPRWGVVELLVEELTRMSGGRRRPDDTVEHFKELYDRAYDDSGADGPVPQVPEAHPAPVVTTEPPPRANQADSVTNWSGSAPHVDTSGGNGGRGNDGGGNGGGGTGGRGRAAAELRRRITDGTYPFGSLLPPQRALADELGVSRLTVQRALRGMQEEGWISSRQGSGSRVVRQGPTASEPGPGRYRRPFALGPYISEAFEQDDVSLDVFTLTSESLTPHIQLQAERIHAGQISPRSITVRLMVPDMSLAFPYWRSGHSAQDDALKERAVGNARRQHTVLHNTLSNVYTSMLVPSVLFTCHPVPLVPPFKLYLLNGTAALHGFYEVIERVVDLDGEWVQTLDVHGLGATLTHHVKDDDPHSPGSVFVDNARDWFESVWHRLADQEGHG
jgi:hypothetical protein